MGLDPAVLEIIIWRRQLLARSRSTINAVLQVTPILLEDSEDETKDPLHGGSKPGKPPHSLCTTNTSSDADFKWCQP
ncbi:hypothetical protein PGTUg99_023979 [Puccinia graminis f. sp. tritici]|uniref:Uncharacterized protein n=1 Tax=Puccinia graminis f. sp. tritici TaxID=56615 RepID=A0A5B0R5P8_PUCGR|nr:hypothetical protein PGTUg99_023979 [Puccinia graminis f. sp. tritici]